MAMRRQLNAGTLFRDFLFLYALGVTFLVLIMLPLVNPPTVTNSDTKPPGNVIVSIAWPAGDVDVDLWVDGPGETKPVGFSNRGGKLWNLLRDDLGNINDRTPMNYESAFSRGMPAGEYVVNIDCYRCTAPPVPVSVEVRLGAFGEKAGLLFQETVALNRPNQERTAIRFRLNADGKIVPGSVSNVYKPLKQGRG